MSQHPSLKVGGAAEAKRTVLTRYERVELLRKRGELKEGDRIVISGTDTFNSAERVVLN